MTHSTIRSSEDPKATKHRVLPFYHHRHPRSEDQATSTEIAENEEADGVGVRHQRQDAVGLGNKPSAIPSTRVNEKVVLNLHIGGTANLQGFIVNIFYPFPPIPVFQTENVGLKSFFARNLEGTDGAFAKHVGCCNNDVFQKLYLPKYRWFRR
jgi:hypothetical protein